MSSENIVVGLDIGTSRVCAVVGEYNEKGILEIIGVGQSECQGLRRGVVVNIEATMRAVSEAVEKAEQMSGRDVSGVVTGISGGNIEGLNSRGVVAVASRGREITDGDVQRVIDAAQAIVIPMDREVLHVIPQEFIIDDQEGIKNPIDMMGVRLEAEVHIITGTGTAIDNIVKCVNRSGFNVNDIILDSIASASSVLTKDEKDMGVLLIDLGAGTTDVLLYLDGAPYHTTVLPVGGNQVTSDLSIMLKTTLKNAEEIKHHAGCCFMPLLEETEQVLIPGVAGRPPVPIARTRVCEIIQPRMAEIFTMIRDQISRKGYLPQIGCGVVLTGGGALLPGAAELAGEVFGMPSAIGIPKEVGGLVEEYRSPDFSTAIGLVMIGSVKQQAEGPVPAGNNVRTRSRFIDNLKNWLKEFF